MRLVTNPAMAPLQMKRANVIGWCSLLSIGS